MSALKLATELKFKVILLKNSKELIFNDQLVTIGRGPENHICFSEDGKVSRQHAKIEVKNGFLTLTNMSEKNLVFVNSQSLEPKREFNIQERAEVQMGESRFTVEPLFKMSLAKEVTPSLPLTVQQNKKQTLAALEKLHPAVTEARSIVESNRQNRSLSSSITFTQPQSQPQAHSAPKLEPNRPSFEPSKVTSDSGRLRFYAILIVVALGLYFLLSGEKNKAPKVESLRTNQKVEKSIQESAESIQKLQELNPARDLESLAYKRAEEHYLKGFRDYRQGQFVRARSSFQAALTSYPRHPLARKYLSLSNKKIEEQISSHMMQGHLYLERSQFRLCRSSFNQALLLLTDPNDLKRKEALQLFRECDKKWGGG